MDSSESQVGATWEQEAPTWITEIWDSQAWIEIRNYPNIF